MKEYDYTISKKKCCVPGCNDREHPRHRFPNPKSNFETFKMWLTVIKNENLLQFNADNVYKSYRVCGRHFGKDVQVVGTRRGLKPSAVPSLFLPGEDVSAESAEHTAVTIPITGTERPSATIMSSQDLVVLDDTFQLPLTTPKASTSSKLLPSPQPSISQREVEMPQKKTDKCRPSTPKKVVELVTEEIPPMKNGKKRKREILKEVHVASAKALTPKAKHFFQKYVQSCNRMKNLSNKLISCRKRLSLAERLAESPEYGSLINHVNSLTYNFIISQVRTQHQKPKARRFTLEEKLLALTILKASGKGYRLLAKIFTLPSRRTLTNLLNSIPFCAGVNKQMFRALHESVLKMKERDRTAVILFDEMAIDCSLHYDQRQDIVIGVEDFGNGNRKPFLADHVNVFMVKGVYRQWKQPLCYTFSSGTIKTIQLKYLIKKIISECQNIDLNIIATVCDQGSTNQSAINALLIETTETFLRLEEENRYFGFLVGEKEIVPVYDIPHLMKGVRNNMLNKDLHFKMNGEHGVARWKHIEQFYFLDTQDEDRICPKLTDEHVIRNKIRKMKVKCCTQVFSHQVGAIMKKIVLWKSQVELDPEAIHTANIILFFDKLFDSLNSNQRYGPPGKTLKGAVTLGSGHIKFWQETIRILKTMKYYSESKKALVSVPSITNFIFSLEAFIYLSKQLIIDNKTFLLTRGMQQDSLENFFCSIRSYSAREISPSALHFITAFKALITNNFMSSHSPTANCEEDISTGALDNLKSFCLGETLPGVAPLPPKDIFSIKVPQSVLANKKSRIGRCTTTYIAGFIARSIIKKRKCNMCKENLLKRDSDADTDFIEARQYEHSKLVTPGSVFNFLVGQSLSRLFFIIPRVCHLSNISSLLQNLLEKDIQFNLINCSEHKDTGDMLCKMIIRCSIFFWCKKINKIAKGKDEKFIRFINSKPNKTIIDPVKLSAHKKWLAKRSRSKKKL